MLLKNSLFLFLTTFSLNSYAFIEGIGSKVLLAQISNIFNNHFDQLYENFAFKDFKNSRKFLGDIDTCGKDSYSLRIVDKPKLQGLIIGNCNSPNAAIYIYLEDPKKRLSKKDLLLGKYEKIHEWPSYKLSIPFMNLLIKKTSNKDMSHIQTYWAQPNSARHYNFDFIELKNNMNFRYSYRGLSGVDNILCSIDKLQLYGTTNFNYHCRGALVGKDSFVNTIQTNNSLLVEQLKVILFYSGLPTPHFQTFYHEH